MIKISELVKHFIVKCNKCEEKEIKYMWTFNE